MTRCINKEDTIQPDIWVLIDQEGESTLFRLVEMGDARDAARMTRNRQMPVVTVDVALPATEPIGPTLRAVPGQERLVVLKIHAVSGTDEASLAVPRPAMTNTHPRLLWSTARGDAKKLTIS